jgi:peptidoglycan glycosyltransferase
VTRPPARTRAALLVAGLAAFTVGFGNFDDALDPATLPESVRGTYQPASPPDQPVEDTVPADLPPVPSRLHAPPLATVKALAPAEDLLARAHRDGAGHYVVREGGDDAVLTLVPEVQDGLTRTLTEYQTPWAAVVVLEPATGRVLAMAEHSQADPRLHGLPVKAVFPAASIFKLVTASALLEEGVSPDDEACYHGGKRRISEGLLEDSTRDRLCLSLSEALGRSANGVFAKLTHRHLTAEKLLAAAALFRFNRLIPFPVPADPSLAAVPDDALGLAQTGAGFGDVYLSPLHGALIAAVAANGGMWRSPVLFERDLAQAADPERVLSEERASALTQMMEETVTHGTARRFFRLPELRGAVGKTGSLADRQPFRDYSWFVGFAPKDSPRVAVAAVVVNEARWRIRAPWLAREAMRLALSAEGRHLAAATTAGAAR